MTHDTKHRQEKQKQMASQLRSVDALIIAHFPPDSMERGESQRVLHQLWALLFLGYNNFAGSDSAPKPGVETGKSEGQTQPSGGENTESSADAIPPKVELVK